MTQVKTAEPVVVSLEDLKSGSIPFTTLLSAFGPDSLGILIVKDLPSTFTKLRTQVLSNSSHLASLSPTKLSQLTNSKAKYLVGWSHGKEKLKPGIIDTAKGSYYINCAFYHDSSLTSAADASQKFPGFEEYTAPNLWPDENDIPGFKSTTEQLITLIIDTAVLVAKACDLFAEKEVHGYEKGYLERIVESSTTTKARLLHYFPQQKEQQKQLSNGSSTNNGTANGHGSKVQIEEEEMDTWCATHLDHGCLTGLTSAMFLDESQYQSQSTTTNELNELPSSPSPSSGLYIRSRSDQVYKVSIPKDCLAFQTGEALELITQGKFKAVPHFVRGVDPDDVHDKNSRIARNTLAVFTQPDLDEVVDLVNGTTFGEFARGIVGKNTAG